MSIPFVTFRPAEYHRGKESFISFYATDPGTGKLKRKRIKLNHIHKKTERDRYASYLCRQINDKLYSGWNPWVEDLGAKAVTISHGIAMFLSSRQKDSRKATLVSYNSQCGIFRSWLEANKMTGKYIVSIDTHVLKQYLSDVEIQRNLGATTYNNYIMFLSVLFSYFVEREFIKENPASALKKRRTEQKKRTTIPADVRSRIKEYFAERSPRFHYVMLLCYRCFVRPKEIRQLRIRDFDRKLGMLTVPSSVAKTRKEREIALPSELIAYLESVSNCNPDWFIFSNPSNFAPGPKQLTHTRIASCWSAMRDELKLPASYQFYSLKDTGITEMLEAGVPAKYVKELADHHSLEMTERYTHRSEAKKILEWNRLEF